ncbi:MAG: helix-hairpin-helix domain-containing protein [Candidatus Rokubacteria bacterium]|nr:helix-hairpin-helix domain-containing protein [Candidatus Rokubacteria bacterium]
MVYRRRELWLLLFLAATLGIGLAVSQFRSGFPDLAERLENLDADAENAAPASPPIPARPPKISEAQTKLNGRLDLNRATADELRRLPGVGPTLADQIVQARERKGRFAAVEDLRTVPGMGAKKIERIHDLVTVEELTSSPK